MIDSTTSTTGNAHRLLAMIFGGIQAQALGVVAELGIADHLQDGPRTLTELADATGTNARALGRVLRLLVRAGLFVESDADTFSCSALGELLRTDAGQSLRDYTRVTNNPLILEMLSQLLLSLRSGSSAFEAMFGRGFYESLQDNPEQAAVFHGAMREISEQDAVAIQTAYDFSNCRTVVDLGGGQGLLLASLLDAYPDMQGVLFDLPEVVDAPAQRLEPHLHNGRCRLVGGDLMHSAPAGGDVYMLKRVLTHFPDDSVRTALGNLRAAVEPDSRVVIADPNPASLYGASFDVLMFLLMDGGLRTDTHLTQLLADSGFSYQRNIDTLGEVNLIEAVPA